MVLLTNPELFVIEERNITVELEGVGRGHTIVDSGPTITVAVGLDVTKAASAFVKTIYAYAA
jgi:hypothetical protein